MLEMTTEVVPLFHMMLVKNRVKVVQLQDSCLALKRRTNIPSYHTCTFPEDCFVFINKFNFRIEALYFFFHPRIEGAIVGCMYISDSDREFTEL